MGVPRLSKSVQLGWMALSIFCYPLMSNSQTDRDHKGVPVNSSVNVPRGSVDPPSPEEILYRKYSQETDPSKRMAMLRDATDPELANLKRRLENQESLSPVQKQTLSDLEAALEARDLDPEDTFKGPADETPEQRLAREAMAERYFEDLGGDQALKTANPQLNQEELDKIPVTEKARALYEKATSKPTESGTESKGKAASPDLNLSDFRNGESYPITQLPEGSSGGNTDSTGYIYLKTNSSDPVLIQKLQEARLGALVGGEYVLRMPSTPETQKRLQEMGLAPYLKDIGLDPKEGAPAFQKQLEKLGTSKEVKNLFTFVPSDGKKESFSEVDYRDPETGEWKSRMAQVRTPTPGFSPRSYGGAEDLAPVMAAGLATEFDTAATNVEKTIQKLTGWKPNPFVTLPVAAVMEGLSSKDTTGLFENSNLTKKASNELTRFALTTWNGTQPSRLNARLVQNALPHSESLKPYVSGAQLLGSVIRENWPGMNPLLPGTPRPSKHIPAIK